jgi:hypothetical protein
MRPEDMSDAEVWAAFGVTRPTVGRRAQISAAAVRAGHAPKVVRQGKRFKFVCECGFNTPANWSMKTSRNAAVEHMILAGRTALGETPLLGTVPPNTPDTPSQSVNAGEVPELVRESSQTT